MAEEPISLVYVYETLIRVGEAALTRTDMTPRVRAELEREVARARIKLERARKGEPLNADTDDT